MHLKGMTTAAVARIEKLSMPESVQGDVHKEIDVLVSGEPEDVEVRGPGPSEDASGPERTKDVPLPGSPITDSWTVKNPGEPNDTLRGINKPGRRTEADMVRNVVQQELSK